MKHYIIDTNQHITLEGTAELMLTNRLMRHQRGAGDFLTQRLEKLVREAIYTNGATASDFYGEECDDLIEELHYCAISDIASWPQAQARLMLTQAML